MRLIVACADCRRQYDAAGVRAGAKFHCTCGEALEVLAPQRGHDAAVVRCSACGASRGATATTCRHCGSDFTLHERDLHTVCPKCVTRVSDRAKFCHHCGQSLASTPIDSVATTLHCPLCEDAPALYDRPIGDPAVTVSECQRCLGLWLKHPAVEELVRRAESSPDIRRLLPQRPTGPSEETASPGNWRYRKCPDCSVVMNRHNLGRASGVIVDTCGTHGVWFDAEELHQLLEWVHRGGATVSPKPARRGMQESARRARRAAERPIESDPAGGSFLGLDLEDVLAFALSLIFD